MLYRVRRDVEQVKYVWSRVRKYMKRHREGESRHVRHSWRFHSTQHLSRFVKKASGVIVGSWVPRDAQHCLRRPSARYTALYDAMLRGAFFPEHSAVDDPAKPTFATAAIGSLGETIFRWIRSTTTPKRVFVQPAAPLPTSSGLIDFIEIHEDATVPDGYRAMVWEIKATDSLAGTRNEEVYDQLDKYPRRLMYQAGDFAEGYTGANTGLKSFLSRLSAHAFEKNEHVSYGAFAVSEETVKEEHRFCPRIHEHPDGTLHGARNEVITVKIPSFKKLRGVIWKALRLP